MTKKILVVDNDPVILKFITNLLVKEGHQVRTAEDGLSALDILMTYIPDIMFIDLVMPNINGKQLCQIIKKIPDLKDTYIVILSATIAEQSKDFSELGADTFIAKTSFDKMAKYVSAAIDKWEENTPRGASEKIIGFKGVYEREITRELISAAGHLQTILSNISDAIIELTPEGMIICANPAAVSLMRLSEEELLGSKFTKLINETDCKSIEDLLIRIDERSEKIGLDTPVLINSRKTSLSIFPVKEDESPSVMLVIKDITDILQAEAILKGLKPQIATQYSIREDMKHSVHALLAEDNPVNQKLATLMLTKAGYQVEVANNGKEAVEKYTGSPRDFDLIFMDIQMPEMDGLEATATIRASELELATRNPQLEFQ